MQTVDTVGGLTADEWRKRVRYEPETGRLIFQEGMKHAGKPAGSWHKKSQCWMLLANKRNWRQKAIKHLMLKGFVPADMRKFPIVNNSADPKIERIEDLEIAPRSEVQNRAWARVKAERRGNPMPKAEKPPESPQVAPESLSVSALDSREDVERKLMARKRVGHTLQC